MHTIFVQCVEIQKVSQKRLQFLKMQKNKKSACNVHKKSVLYESTVKRTL